MLPKKTIPANHDHHHDHHPLVAEHRLLEALDHVGPGADGLQGGQAFQLAVQGCRCSGVVVQEAVARR